MGVFVDLHLVPPASCSSSPPQCHGLRAGAGEWGGGRWRGGGGGRSNTQEEIKGDACHVESVQRLFPLAHSYRGNVCFHWHTHIGATSVSTGILI